jgi:hypothetical protein
MSCFTCQVSALQSKNNDKGDRVVVARGRTLVGEADFSAGPAHDETVSSFGRDDGSLVPGEKNRQRNDNATATVTRRQCQSNGNRGDAMVRSTVCGFCRDEIWVRTSGVWEVRSRGEAWVEG